METGTVHSMKGRQTVLFDTRTGAKVKEWNGDFSETPPRVNSQRLLLSRLDRTHFSDHEKILLSRKAFRNLPRGSYLRESWRKSESLSYRVCRRLGSRVKSFPQCGRAA